jgi:ubiquinone/menaquinone biosynthesis C-methylase UbiE
MTVRDDESSIVRAYDVWSHAYDVDSNATRDLDASVLRQQQLALSSAHVLEIGCGTGKNTAWLMREARQVVALDFSEGMLSKARQRLPDGNVQFVRHDLRETWPVDDLSQDVVVGNLVLEHLRDVPFVFREAHRVLRDGGRLFLCELHPFRQLQGSKARFVTPGTQVVEHVTAYLHDVSEYLNAAVSAGFILREVAEWRDPGSDQASVPRLFSGLWNKPVRK